VSNPEHEDTAEHQVTPLELFFDLTFVFGMTQVTILLADDPTWSGVLRGMLVLAALWWGWTVYAWLTSGADVDEGGVRLVMLASMGAMFGVALAVPGAFGDDAVLFGVAYVVVRMLDRESRSGSSRWRSTTSAPSSSAWDRAGGSRPSTSPNGTG
jgi:low temperature requirement protein LtrA